MGVQPERRGAVTDNLFLSNIELRPDEFLGNVSKMTHDGHDPACICGAVSYEH